MSKKYKGLVKYLVISMIFIVAIVAAGYVYSSSQKGYDPTREEFRTVESSSLLREKIRIWWKILE